MCGLRLLANLKVETTLIEKQSGSKHQFHSIGWNFLLELVGFQASGFIRSSSNPEFIIEFLVSNIRVFFYDPEKGLVFDRWYGKYEEEVLKDGKNLDDEAEVWLLLQSLSVTIHDEYVNF